MATTLFLHDAVATEAGAPANYKRIDRTQGAAAATKTMTNVAGSTPIQWTDGAGGANLAWISDEVLTAFTLSGTITLNIRGNESNNNDNVGPQVRIYKYSGSEGAAFSTSTTASEFTTSEQARNWTDAAPTSTDFAVGDRIVVKVFAAPVGGVNMTAGTANIYINGAAGATGDSYVSFTENIAFTRTRTVKSASGDYTTLSAWNTGEAADLVTLTEVRQAELYALQDTTALGLTATWVTSATYFVKIYTTGAGRNTTGVYDGSNYYRLEVTNANALAISTAPGHVWVDGLQVKVIATSGSRIGINVMTAPATGSPVYKISNNIIQGAISGTATGCQGLVAGTTTNAATMNAWNNIIYSFTVDGRAYQLNAANWTVNAYNNTAYGNVYGYIGSSGVTAINCIANNNSTDGFFSTFGASSNYNTSDIASDAPGANSRNGTAVTFNNAAGGDFRPDSTDTEANGTGTDDPGAGLFSDDITGTARTAGWDIGAFIAEAAPATSVPNQLMMMGCGV